MDRRPIEGEDLVGLLAGGVLDVAGTVGRVVIYGFGLVKTPGLTESRLVSDTFCEPELCGTLAIPVW